MGCSRPQRQKALGHNDQWALGPTTPWGKHAKGPLGTSLRAVALQRCWAPTGRGGLAAPGQQAWPAPLCPGNRQLPGSRHGSLQSGSAHRPLIRYSLLHNVRCDLWNFPQYPVITGPPRIHQACYFSANYILIYRLQPLLIGSGHQLL